MALGNLFSLMSPFKRGLLMQRAPVLAWVSLLAGANMLAVFFLARIEGKVVLGALAIGAVIMELLAARTGFTRLLGVGHVLWFPMLVWLWGRLPQAPVAEPFGIWLRAVMLLNAISLVIDTSDVVRYVRGERGQLAELD